MKILKQTLLFFGLFVFVRCTVQGQDRQLSYLKKTSVSKEEEKLSVKISHSNEYFLLNQCLDRLSEQSLANAAKNKSFNTKYPAIQYNSVINSTFLSVQQKKDSLAAMGMASSKGEEAIFQQFTVLNRKFYDAFPELKSLPRENKIRILEKANHLLLNNQQVLQQ